jgi:glycosyltransferase involved in cell wall biosynthesis
MYDASFYGRVIAFLLKIPTVMLVANTYSRKKVTRGWVNFFLGAVTNKVIVVGEDVKTDVLRFDRLPTSKVVVIPSFTILDYMPVQTQTIRKNLGIKQDDYVMLFIARLVEQKGISYLIEALNICVNEFGANHLKLIIVGDGVLQGDLVKLTQEMRLANHIFFVGEQRYLNGYLTESDCYTDSSLWAGLSLAAIKALEAGLPMIITDVGGARQLTADGLYGKLCQPRSAQSLADAIQHFYMTRPERNLQARIHIQENFSDVALSGLISKIYQDALGKYE